MRTDHYAYQQATRVAAFGLALQCAMGLALLAFGLLNDDTAFRFASYYVLSGVLVWLGLVIVFHQHKLERLEALEEDELAASRGGSTSMFDSAATETRVAARRLAMMHKWLMPALSLLLAIALGGLAALMFSAMSEVYRRTIDFERTDETGWGVAISLGLAVICFIFSRFIAGMAKQHAWQNLRGGASFMVGNAIVLFAVAIGVIFSFWENYSVLIGVCWAIPCLMALQVLEVILNFILNLYRPRIPGEVPRPAFDSRVLSWFASPDSIVRSLNEAVNYQFGFDVTSSWGYQLLLRSFVWLLALGVVSLLLLDTMVIVEPYQQAVRLRGGAMVLNEQGQPRVYGSGIMWKRPWPFETAALFDVTSVRTLPLTAQQRMQRDVNLWSDEIRNSSVGTIESFVVGSSAAQRSDDDSVVGGKVVTASLTDPASDATATLPAIAPPGGLGAEERRQSETAATLSRFYSLVDAEIILQYRIRGDQDGLIAYLNFAPDSLVRGSDLTDRERALRAIAVGQISAHLSTMSLDDVLSPGRTDLTSDLRTRIQSAFDARRTGVEVVDIALPMLRPGDIENAKEYEELTISTQAALQAIAQASAKNVAVTFADTIGDEVRAIEAIAAIDLYNRLAAEHGSDSPLAREQRVNVERLIVSSGGASAQAIEKAETDRWITLMNERSRASQLTGQLPQFLAAPNLYRQKRLMAVYANTLPPLRKFVIGIDPSNVSVQADMKSIDPILDFSSSINPEENQ